MLIVSGIPDSSEPRISDFTATICWIPDFTSKNFPHSLACGEVLLNDDNSFLFFYLLFFFFALSARETFNSFSEEKFCEYMKRATLRGEEFAKHREAIRELLTN